MAVYKMTVEDLARYISDTEFKFKTRKITSTMGIRKDSISSNQVTVKDLDFPELTVKTDCFLSEYSMLQILVHLPEFTYTVIMEETAQESEYGINNKFEFFSPKRTFVIEFEKKKLNGYQDFENASKIITSKIEEELTKNINRFQRKRQSKAYCDTLEGVKIDIWFTVYPSCDKETN